VNDAEHTESWRFDAGEVVQDPLTDETYVVAWREPATGSYVLRALPERATGGEYSAMVTIARAEVDDRFEPYEGPI
jgi:hypothetical protein